MLQKIPMHNFISFLFSILMEHHQTLYTGWLKLGGNRTRREGQREDVKSGFSKLGVDGIVSSMYRLGNSRTSRTKHEKGESTKRGIKIWG